MRTVKTLVVVALLTPILAPGFPAVSQDCATPRDVESIVGRHDSNISGELRGLSSDISQEVSRELSGLPDEISRTVSTELSREFDAMQSSLDSISQTIGESLSSDDINQKLDQIIQELTKDSPDSVSQRISGLREQVGDVKRRMSSLEDSIAELSSKTGQISRTLRSLDSKIESAVNGAVSSEFQEVKQRQETLTEQNLQIQDSLAQIKDELGIGDDSQQDGE